MCDLERLTDGVGEPTHSLLLTITPRDEMRRRRQEEEVGRGEGGQEEVQPMDSQEQEALIAKLEKEAEGNILKIKQVYALLCLIIGCCLLYIIVLHFTKPLSLEHRVVLHGTAPAFAFLLSYLSLSFLLCLSRRIVSGSPSSGNMGALQIGAVIGTVLLREGILNGRGGGDQQQQQQQQEQQQQHQQQEEEEERRQQISHERRDRAVGYGLALLQGVFWTSIFLKEHVSSPSFMWLPLGGIGLMALATLLEKGVSSLRGMSGGLRDCVYDFRKV